MSKSNRSPFTGNSLRHIQSVLRNASTMTAAQIALQGEGDIYAKITMTVLARVAKDIGLTFQKGRPQMDAEKRQHIVDVLKVATTLTSAKTTLQAEGGTYAKTSLPTLAKIAKAEGIVFRKGAPAKVAAVAAA